MLERITASLRGETKSNAFLVPIVDYNTDYECFQLKNGEFLDIKSIVSKDLFNSSADDLNFDTYNFSKFYKMYGKDIKIVGMNLPTDTHQQQGYVKHKIETTNNVIFKEELQIKSEELEYIEKNSMDRSFYLFYYANSPNKLEDYRVDIEQILGKCDIVRPIDQEEKETIFFKFNNMNSVILNQIHKESVIEVADNHVTMDQVIQKKGYNPFLLERIQPQGGISFKDERYIKTGDGYMCCVTIYSYPTNVSRLWMQPLLNLANSITTVDIKTESLAEVRRNINRSMKENRVRIKTEKDDSDSMDAESRYYELQELYRDISNMGEVIKTICIRVFLSAKTMKELDDAVSYVLDELKGRGYSGAIFLNESKNDWKSFYCSYTKQLETVYKRVGQAVTSSTLAAGHPYHYTNLSDPYGRYYGWTTGSGGKVLMDIFHKTVMRLSYNIAVLGKMGSGKSTLLKKIMMTLAICGDYIRGLDPSNEWIPLIEYLGGKIISLDGSQGIINPLEIFKTGDTEESSYLMHIGKLDTMYKFLVPSCGELEAIEFTQLVHMLYEEWNIVSSGERIQKQITGLNPTDYPILTDLLNLVTREISKITSQNMTATELEAVKERLNILGKIESVLKNIVKNYGYILNGHTSIENLLHTQIVFFNIKNLKSMKEEIFDAQIFNVLTLCWNNCIVIGEKMKKGYEDGSIALKDITHFLLFVDEAHKLINTRKTQAVRQLLEYSREARKYFGSLLFASQSIRDFVPEGSNQEGIAMIKTLFELTQYKFIMQQEDSTLETLNQVFKNQLTQTELKRIPRLGEGQTILSITGDKNIEFTIDASKDELAIYQGGA